MMRPGSVTTARFSDALRRIFQVRGGESEAILVPEIQPTAVALTGRELEYDLPKGILHFSGYGYHAAVAGQSSIIQVWNPPSSGGVVVCRFRSIWISAIPGTVLGGVIRDNTAIGGVLIVYAASPNDSRRRQNSGGNEIPAVQIQAGTQVLAAPFNTSPMFRQYIDANFAKEPSPWFVCYPGSQAYIYANTVNVAMQAQVEGYVREIDARELQD